MEKEQHQVGIKMVADVFEMHGWESFFLGSGVPSNELIKFIHQVKPDLLAISLSVYFNFTNLLKLLNIIKKEFHTLQIIVGGQAFNRMSNSTIEEMENVVLLSDLYICWKNIFLR